MIDYFLNKKGRILSHILFWLFIFAVFAFLYGYRNSNYGSKLVLQLKFAAFEIGFTYFILYYLIPKFLMKRKFLLFVIIFILSLYIVLAFENLAMMTPKALPMLTFELFLRSLIMPQFFWLAFENIFVVLLASTIKLLKVWYINQKEKSDLEKRNLESELELLKNQINPHFLFNTLNNINTLVFLDQQKTYDSIIKLSELLRYMIYETREQKVFLKDEISYINNYIELQRLRYKDKRFIEFEIKGNAGTTTVAPMVFITFIENAFKHSKKAISSMPGISIKFEISKTKIYFYICNYTKSEIGNKNSNGGLGIENIKKRLALIYPEKHSLTIVHNEKFSVNLCIQI